MRDVILNSVKLPEALKGLSCDAARVEHTVIPVEVSHKSSFFGGFAEDFLEDAGMDVVEENTPANVLKHNK